MCCQMCAVRPDCFCPPLHSPQLVAVLREVKYLNFQQQKDIPRSAENLFSQYETFRKFVGNLELIVGWYNEVSWRHTVFLFAAFGGFRLGQRCTSPMWSRMEYVSVNESGWNLPLGESLSLPSPPPRVAHIPGLEATSHHLQITTPPLLLSPCLLICFYWLPLIRTLPSSWTHLTSRSLTESHRKPSFARGDVT